MRLMRTLLLAIFQLGDQLICCRSCGSRFLVLSRACSQSRIYDIRPRSAYKFVLQVGDTPPRRPWYNLSTPGRDGMQRTRLETAEQQISSPDPPSESMIE